MLVTVIKDFSVFAEAEVQGATLPVLLNGLKQAVGKQVTDFVTQNVMKYVLVDTSGRLKPIGLCKEVAFGEFKGFNRLVICTQDSVVEGSDPGTLIVMAIGATSMVTAATATAAASLTILGMVTAFAINLAIGFALSMLMSLLSPTPTFGDDPANTQATSSLFENAPLIRKQGGSCPLIFGSPYCGGVLINIKISSSDVY